MLAGRCDTTESLIRLLASCILCYCILIGSYSVSWIHMQLAYLLEPLQLPTLSMIHLLPVILVWSGCNRRDICLQRSSPLGCHSISGGQCPKTMLIQLSWSWSAVCAGCCIVVLWSLPRRCCKETKNDLRRLFEVTF